MANRKPDTIEKVRQKLVSNSIIDSVTGCWLYQGVPLANGYCAIMFNGKRAGIHRLSLHINWGFDLDSEEYVLHKPNCPNKNCWNPEHLYVGTQADNVMDSIIAGTHPSSKI